MKMKKQARHASVPAAETLLDDDPFEGDLDARLAEPERRSLPGLTAFLVAGLVAVAGFIGGVQAHKTWGGADPDSGRSAAQGPGQGGSGQEGRGRGGRGQGGFPQGPGSENGSPGGLTSGTVTGVEDGVVSVKTSDGRTVQVRTDGETEITVSRKGSAEDLKSGTSVVVRGETADDGTVTASTVTEGSGTGGFGGTRPPNGN